MCKKHYPTPILDQLLTHDRIGRLIVVDPDAEGEGLDVVCDDCCRKLGWNTIGTPIFKSNIFPYMQKCHECEKVLVEGVKGFPTLFGKRG